MLWIITLKLSFHWVCNWYPYEKRCRSIYSWFILYGDIQNWLYKEQYFMITIYEQIITLTMIMIFLTVSDSQYIRTHFLSNEIFYDANIGNTMVCIQCRLWLPYFLEHKMVVDRYKWYSIYYKVATWFWIDIL